MNQFPLNITGAQSSRQTGRSPTSRAVLPALSDVPILEKVSAGKAQPPRVVILTALAVEFLAVEQFVQDRQEIKHFDGTVYEYGRFTRGEVVWDVAIVEAGQGNRKAATETQRAIAHFRPDVVLFVGVAGGRKDVIIGDVVAADKIYNYESGRDEIAFQPRPEAERASYSLEQRARAVVRDWLRRKQAASNENLPNAFVGAIAAGEKVIASTDSATAKLLGQNYGDALAVEKEGYGFLAAAREIQSVSALVIRGISDLLDNKQATDKQGSQQLAARHASEFAFELLANLNGSLGTANPGPTADQVGILNEGSLRLDLNQKPPESIAILRFHQYENSYSIHAYHSKMETLNQTEEVMTLQSALGKLGSVYPGSIEIVGNFDGYHPKQCMVGQSLKWLQFLQKQESTFACLVIEEPHNSIVPWELLNLGDQPLGVTLQTVRSRSMLNNDDIEQSVESCCQGQTMVYTSGEVERISLDFPEIQTYRYDSFVHDDPAQVFKHFQKVVIETGLVVMSDLALYQVTRGGRTAYLKRTKLLKTMASIVMLQLSMPENITTEAHREIAVTFLEHGARGVLGMLENVDGAISREIMNAFLMEYGREPDIPIPEILRRLRVTIVKRLENDLTDEMSRLYLATFMYAYYGHPLTVLQLTPNQV